MAFSKILFPLFRAVQVLTLIPIWGMLAWFVHQYHKNDTTPPTEILVLWIVALIATFWAIVSFFQFHRSLFISLVVFVMDLLVLGGLIAGVVLLRAIRHANCSTGVTVGNWNNRSGWSTGVKKSCVMLKTAWAFAVIKCVLWFITALLAISMWRKNESRAVRDKGYAVEQTSAPRRSRRRWY